MMGRFATGTIGFGRLIVSGFRRVPKPPAMMTPFNPPPCGCRGLHRIAPGRAIRVPAEAAVNVRSGSAAQQIVLDSARASVAFCSVIDNRQRRA
jgi:hypothetical protein